MLDRLVYVLFFIFIGSGLFLVYQGLKGMGYLGPTPVISQQPTVPTVPQRPVVKVEEKTGTGLKIGNVNPDDLEAVAFMVKYLPATDQAAGCQFFLDHYNQLQFKPGELNLEKLMQNVLGVIRSSSQLSTTDACLLGIAKKTLLLAEKTPGLDFKSEDGAEFLSVVVPRLAWGGYFSLLSKFYDQFLPVLKMKLPFYLKHGRIIEQALCESLKHMGRNKECLLLYPIQDSPNVQIYTLGYRVFFDGEWSRLKIYFTRMKNFKEAGAWAGFGEFLEGVYAFYDKQNYNSAIAHFATALEKANEKTDRFLLTDYRLSYLRSFRKLDRHEQALGNVDGFLREAYKEKAGSNFGIMILLLQKMIILKEMNKPIQDSQIIQKRFADAKPDDEYGALMAKAFDALITNNKNYKTTLPSPEFLEVEAALKTQ